MPTDPLYYHPLSLQLGEKVWRTQRSRHSPGHHEVVQSGQLCRERRHPSSDNASVRPLPQGLHEQQGTCTYIGATVDSVTLIPM